MPDKTFEPVLAHFGSIDEIHMVIDDMTNVFNGVIRDSPPFEQFAGNPASHIIMVVETNAVFSLSEGRWFSDVVQKYRKHKSLVPFNSIKGVEKAEHLQRMVVYIAFWMEFLWLAYSFQRMYFRGNGQKKPAGE